MIDVKAIRAAAEEDQKQDTVFVWRRPQTVIALLDRLEAAEKDAARIRNAALEEAAVKCEEIDFSYSACEQFVSGEAAFECGKQIRSMKK